MDLNKFASFSEETKRLEFAYNHLQAQFYELKGKLESSHQTLMQIVMHMTDGLIFVAKEGSVILFNPAATELLGIGQDKVAQGLFWEHFDDNLFGFSMKEALENGACCQRIFITLDEEKEVEISTSMVPEKGLLLLLCNRTEQQKLLKSLHQAERLKELGEMAATLAHEIRNPLGGIEGFARLLKRDLEAPSHQRMLHAILEGTSALNHLVSEVLDYARPLRLHFAPIDLVTLVKETLNAAQLPCTFKSAHPNYYLSLDREKIQRVLLNVLRNAKEAEASAVKIALTEEGKLIIKDNGKGINPKNLEKIFTPFFTTKAQGTGLGLAHSLAIIKAHDGTLEISSEVGKGTQLIIKL